MSTDEKIMYEPMLQGIPLSSIRAECRVDGDSTWHPLPVYRANSHCEHPHRNGGEEGWVSLATERGLSLRFRLPHTLGIRTACYRPSMRHPVETSIQDNVVSLHLPAPRYGVLEINDLDKAHGIPVFTIYILIDSPCDGPNPEDTDAVHCLAPGTHEPAELDWGAAKTLYFQPGLHVVKDNVIRLQSDHDLYLARGAVVRSRIEGENVENVKIYGQGILDGTHIERMPPSHGDEVSGMGQQGFVWISRSRNVILDGPTIYNPPFWNIVLNGTEQVRIRNHKAIAWLVNNDGVQPRSVRDLRVEHCFLKCNDDCIAIKSRRAVALESRDIVCSDLVLWNDTGGNPLEIGHTSQADVLENIVFRDIDIVHGCKGHSLDICIVDHSLVRNVLYENIYIEGYKCPFDVGIHVGKSMYSTDKVPGRVKNVRIHNLCSDGEPQGSTINGTGSELRYVDTGCLPVDPTVIQADGPLVENVVFSSLVWNYGQEGKEKKACCPDDMKLNIYNARDIVFE